MNEEKVNKKSAITNVKSVIGEDGLGTLSWDDNGVQRLLVYKNHNLMIYMENMLKGQYNGDGINEQRDICP